LKRRGFLWDQIVNYDNLALAHKRARRGKGYQRQVKVVDASLHDRIVERLPRGTPSAAHTMQTHRS